MTSVTSAAGVLHPHDTENFSVLKLRELPATVSQSQQLVVSVVAGKLRPQLAMYLEPHLSKGASSACLTSHPPAVRPFDYDRARIQFPCRLVVTMND